MATGPGRHHGGEQHQTLVERQAQAGVVTIHQDERTGLQLGHHRVAVPCAGAPTGHHVTAHLGMGGGQDGHGPGRPRPALVGVEYVLEVPLVAHGAAHGQTGASNLVGQTGGVCGITATSGHAHVHVDQHLVEARRRGHGDRLDGVDGHGHPGTGSSHSSQALCRPEIHQFVG